MSRSAQLNLKSPAVILGLLRAADAAVVAVASVVAYGLRHEWEWPDQQYYLATLIGVLVAAQVFHFGRLYLFALLDQPVRQLLKAVSLLVVTAAVMMALAFFTKESELFSRAWAGLWLLLAALGIFLLRVAVFYRLQAWRRDGELTRNTVVVGAGEHGRRLIEHIRTSPDAGLVLRGVFDDRQSRVPQVLEGVPLLGNVQDLLTYVRAHPVDLIIIALPWAAERRLLHIMNELRTVPVDVQLAPDHVGFNMYERGVTHLAGVPMLTVFERPLAGWNFLLKAAEDRILAALMLAAFAPLMLLIALAIKLTSPGPVLFRQKRYGFNNEVFEVFKFRTMRHQAAEEAGTPQAKRNDPRITRIGAFLRRSSLDELPQLLNVLRGDMSLVGPRPHAVAHNEEFSRVVQQYYARHRVKPGITGWAQVHGYRGETDTQEKIEKRVQYDLYYIDNWSLLLDLRILAMTLVVGFVNRNAY